VISGWHEVPLVIDGPIKSADGYGNMTENMILAFDRAGFVVFPGHEWEHNDYSLTPERIKEIIDLRDFDQGVFNGATVGVRNSQPDSFDSLTTPFRLGFSMFEFTKMPSSWVPGANTVDVNLVPCTWCKEIWVESGVTQPVEVLPLGARTDLYTYLDRPERDTFTFCMTGSLSARKAPWMAWAAFQLAFPGRDDVRLVFKTPAALSIRAEGDDRVTAYNEDWPLARMVDVLHRADCFVYPTRSEGFGFSPVEAMSTGLPVICTNVTAMTDYLFPEHSYPLDIEGWEEVPSHWGDIGCYATPSLDHLVSLMRHVYDNRAEARAKGRLAAVYVREELTWQRLVERFVGIVERYM
jgi:glycosyltransferase involved in cell wall biosynthesis